MPKLDAAKEAEIVRTLAELNQQVLSEIAKPEAARRKSNET
ncbi:MAG: hypothetical protein P8Y44_02980 [Acidobacteriota bacterium]